MQTSEEIVNGIFEKQKQLGLSNQQLADAAEIPRTTLERIKRKETQAPAMQTILSLAAAVGYQIGEVKVPQEDGITQMIQTYEDRIARQRAFYNMILEERSRVLRYAFYTICGLLGVILLLVILLIIMYL